MTEPERCRMDAYCVLPDGHEGQHAMGRRDCTCRAFSGARDCPRHGFAAGDQSSPAISDVTEKRPRKIGGWAEKVYVEEYALDGILWLRAAGNGHGSIDYPRETWVADLDAACVSCSRDLPGRVRKIGPGLWSNRFEDRDEAMRFELGKAIGHVRWKAVEAHRLVEAWTADVAAIEAALEEAQEQRAWETGRWDA